MALPVSGPLSLASIQSEFGGSSPISLSEYYRGGSYVTTNNSNVPSSGIIRISNFYGAVKQFAFTLTGTLNQANLRSLAVAYGWNGTDAVLCTNNALISSSTTGAAGLTIDGSFPNGVILVNNNYITGMGGNGGSYGQSGGAGGTAVAIGTAVSITNNSVFAGGGGGGASSPVFGWGGVDLTYGGGAGASGLYQASGGDGNEWRDGSPSGYDPGTGMYLNAGTGGYACWSGVCNDPSGNGGSWGSPGGSSSSTHGAAGYSGGAAGYSVTGNGYVTWLATGTRYGPIG